MTQAQKILQHLQQDPITPMEALEIYGIFRLAARINELRSKGHNITTTNITRNGKTFAEYKLAQQ